MRASIIRTEYLSFILQPARHFTTNIIPLLNTNLRVKMFHTENQISEVAQDNGRNVTLGISSRKVHHQTSKVEFREMTPRPCQRMLIKNDQCQNKGHENESKRELFLVRHVDDKLIGRSPCAEPEIPTILDRGYTMARTLRSPCHHSTSQLDTVSSLMHRSPKIPHTSKVFCKGHCDWCSVIHHNPLKENESRLQETFTDYSEEPTEIHCPAESYSCCKLHHYSELCTICQLYRQYFGMPYPRHVT